jgi:inner membrane transporter RhtA
MRPGFRLPPLMFTGDEAVVVVLGLMAARRLGLEGADGTVGHALAKISRVTVAALDRAATAGLLCSAVPMVADTLALRRVPARFFGVFMSVNPVFAALTGLVVLGQSPGLAGWLAIAAIVTANMVSVSTAAGRAAPARRPATGHECDDEATVGPCWPIV